LDGIVNIYKEKGMSSHDVVAKIRRHLKLNYVPMKVGHAGTLDPSAEGVLIVMIGLATKLSDYIMSADKEYLTEITFGIVTDTYDGDGKIISNCLPSFSKDKLSAVIQLFEGEQEQIPPMYSAIKQGGKKLYELARKGIEVERPARKIHIHHIDLESFNGYDKAVLRIACSKGTYIRSLAYDIGKKLECGAHMSALTRTRSGIYTEKDSIKLSDFLALDDIKTAIIPI
jgi:tRNA pseudouridine55 synthase